MIDDKCQHLETCPIRDSVESAKEAWNNPLMKDSYEKLMEADTEHCKQYCNSAKSKECPVYYFVSGP